MKTEKFKQLVLAQNDPALCFSDSPNALRMVMAEVKIYYRSLGIGRQFEDDTEERERLRIKLTRGSRSIEFDYGMSIEDTKTIYSEFIKSRNCYLDGELTEDLATFIFVKHKAKEAIQAGLLYNLLICIGNEYGYPKIFAEFCDAFGYDRDSIKANKIHQLCLEQSAKLERIFCPEDMKVFPR